ncbi:MAG: hypothetical protein M3R38_33190 [Actinomycetota bacterium]|nr:hypothetical protein [Actinomycetota bacterium]
MPLEPAHEALLGALRQQVHDLVEFEIDEYGAVRAALLEREIVHAEHPDTFPTSGSGAPLILLSKVSRAARMPSSSASLAPALPPSWRAIARSASSSRSVLRARAAIFSGSRSQKIRLSHEASSQKKRLARTTSRVTEIPCQGRSETARE